MSLYRLGLQYTILYLLFIALNVLLNACHIFYPIDVRIRSCVTRRISTFATISTEESRNSYVLQELPADQTHHQRTTTVTLKEQTLN
jgi:hypothetical protein